MNSRMIQLTRTKNADNSLNAAFLSTIASISQAHSFIESGTFMGDTANLASEIFPEVHSIELSPQLYQQAVKRFAGKENVVLHFGDSAQVLPLLLKNIKGCPLFWLDGHYSEGITAKGEKNTPIIEELQAIGNHAFKDFFLLIDDIRFFQNPAEGTPTHSSLSGYPTLGQLCDKITEINADFQIIIIGDLAFAYPKKADFIISPTIMACTLSRLYDERGHVPTGQILDAELNIIARTNGEELDALQDLHRKYAGSEEFGAGGHYRLWNGLTLAFAGQHMEACEQYICAMKIGMNHWRIKWYLANSLHLCNRSSESVEYLKKVLHSAPDFFEAQRLLDKINTGVLGAVNLDSGSLPLEEIHDFNQRTRDRWIAGRAATVAPGARVLDIGAGTCPYRSLFAHCDYKAHDFKKYTGEKLGGTTDYGYIDYVSEISSIAVDDASFDVILCTEVFEHIPEPGLAIQEMVRILRPGGRIFLTAPLGSGLHQLPYHYYGGFSPEWYRYWAAKTGLALVEIVPNGGFFRMLAQECARAANLLGSCAFLTQETLDQMRPLLSEKLPRFFFAIEDSILIDQFTVGYHVELVKPAPPGAPPEAPEAPEGPAPEDHFGRIMRLKQAHFERLTK